VDRDVEELAMDGMAGGRPGRKAGAGGAGTKDRAGGAEKILSRRGTGRRRSGGQHFFGSRCKFAQVWFMGKHILVEDSRGAGGVVLGTAAKDMGSATTEHAPLKTGRVRNFKSW
jgi:hypothetical protein